ncbi:ribosomal subunit interface protein [Candidatus Desantisbacteria bacterium CG_4_10_14_0_8_um_filter_48_22]|uniref:Ribosome hibernation promoting factor n=1 Tax=Candidatus Desantisbacteria bacterium CG_4_10_14_0_8_um_filter_48_22 TaxID=1974543 RepID=A0A2M7S5A8_9BACT|nr:MAG: ribosomal subunit interface protein [Candidatus Desantisbacteria bacterium CG1_02_49_89]PIV54282.1 MAG: ribosomal subunit interface protein [Candidatus Desantisbacteria bacterium CG02_land_8_20_14_3_00_49_13]PIZ14508.1 MAG: ribosomal subunit interface protein [Candidatus Desantisbacteria bacterium CG_4_10_14_0_8_um_filter_48_22]PJB27403.1 MAG: ribosomal subunit interface protein [Candidatus Desantisbacteria bacterium CG_4_9_14_3_um_filter_50_7]
MDISITGKHIELTDPIKAYIRKRILSLEKYFRRDGDWANAILGAEREMFLAEVTIGGTGKGTVIYAQASTSDMYASIDAVKEKLEKQARKFKDKLKSEKKRRSMLGATHDKEEMLAASGAGYAPGPGEGAPEGVVVKKIPVTKPMTVDEAKAQLDLSGNIFLVFQNADNYRLNIIYKRKDGKYGLLEP